MQSQFRPVSQQIQNESGLCLLFTISVDLNKIRKIPNYMNLDPPNIINDNALFSTWIIIIYT